MSMPNYFAYDPFTRRTRTTRYAPQGDQDTWTAYDQEEEYWDLSDALRGADPRLAENWGNPDNMEVQRDGDGYRVRIKTGDKEGTWYNLTPDERGGFTPSVAGRGEWNTNENLFDDKMALAMMAAVGGIGAAAAAGAGAGAAGSGGFGAAEGTVAAANLTSDPLGALIAQNAGNWGLNIAPEFAASIGGELLANMPLTEAPPGLNPTQTQTIIEAAGTGADANSLVKSIADGLGISEDVARLIVGLGPAVVTGIGNLLEDDEDNQVTRTGNPTIDAARESLVTKMMGGLDERIARDRARSDQLAGWSSAAAAIPQSLPEYRGLMETDEFGRVRFRKPARGLTGA
jgi:hypothetical protein